MFAQHFTSVTIPRGEVPQGDEAERENAAQRAKRVDGTGPKGKQVMLRTQSSCSKGPTRIHPMLQEQEILTEKEAR